MPQPGSTPFKTVATVLIEDGRTDSGEGAAAVSVAYRPRRSAVISANCWRSPPVTRPPAWPPACVETAQAYAGPYRSTAADSAAGQGTVRRPELPGAHRRDGLYPMPDYDPTLAVKFSSALTSPFAEVTVLEQAATPSSAAAAKAEATTLKDLRMLVSNFP